MTQEPFLYLHSDGGPRRMLSVLPGHEGFVLHESGLTRFGTGMHRLACRSVDAVFLVRVGGQHRCDLHSLGGLLLRGPDGRRRPIKMLGRLSYSVLRAEGLVDYLVREQIYEPRQLERELGRSVVETLAGFFDGDVWGAEALEQSLDLASAELLAQLAPTLSPVGLSLDGLELVAASSPPTFAGR